MKRFATIGAVVIGAWLVLAAPALAAPPVGPPYPDAVAGQRVYDYAGIFTERTISQSEAIIKGIEARTGAQVAVYTQVKPESDNLDKANADALALMNQWGVGRKGFDDGLVILFDMQPNLRHGQVSLYAGSGYRAAFLSDADRQAIFDDDMKPLLAAGALDDGLLVGLNAIDANATPEHAAALESARQVNALMAAGGVLIGLTLVLLTLGYWLLHGRDPVYIDDNSILMPAPPPDLTPAMATLLLDDKTSNRTVTAGLVDLAARGCIAFVAEVHPIADSQTGIKFLGQGDGHVPALEAALRDDIARKSENHDGLIAAHSLYRLIDDFDTFKSGLEDAAVKRDWLRAKPSAVVLHWGLIGSLEIAAAIVAGFIWLFVMASGLFLAAVGLAAAGIVTLAMATSMPARTRQGAMVVAMLAAYRRTMTMALAQARSMTDVVASKALPWVTTPDQAMAWGVAFGLDDEIEAVMARSMGTMDATPDPQASNWYPSWMLAQQFGGHSSHGSTTQLSSGSSAGLFSASALPDPGSLMAALGSISHPSLPASSGGSSSSSSSFSSGGFGGGGGGGGGGAGGGF